MNTECQRVEEYLVDYVEGTLPDNVRAEIEEHIQRCAGCDHLIREFLPIWKSLLTKERKAPPRSFWPALVQRIQSYDRPERVWERTILRFKRSLQPIALALLFLLGAFFGYKLGQTPEDAGRPTSGEEYFAEYLEAFQDFPLGSAVDFYLMYSNPKQGETP